jgi:hypothetical protein
VSEPVTLSMGCEDIRSRFSLRMHRASEPDRLVIEVHVPFELIEQFTDDPLGQAATRGS